MKLVISQGGVKRELESRPFAFCADKQTVEALMDACNRFLERGGYFGWIDVYEPVVLAPNTTPQRWGE